MSRVNYTVELYCCLVYKALIRSNHITHPQTVSKIFTLGVNCPQNLKSKIGKTDISLRAGYRSWDVLQRDTVLRNNLVLCHTGHKLLEHLTASTFYSAEATICHIE